MKAVLGIGNALVDTIYTLPLPAGELKGEIVPGIPNHVTADLCARVQKIVEGIPSDAIAGGGAANTAAAAAALGMGSSFLGKVGSDLYGNLFEDSLLECGVKPHLSRGNLPTGCTMLFPQGDGVPGTFVVSIGAAGEFHKCDISNEIFKGYDYLHMEGFLLNCGDIAEHALEIASLQGMTISFDLGSKGVVERHPDRVVRIVEKIADIVFANEMEALAFTGEYGAKAAMAIAGKMKNGGIAVVKMGEKGSVVARQGEIYQLDAMEVEFADSLGAGDAYAAGFIYAHSLGASLEQCGKAGSITASGAVGVRGPRMNKSVLKRVKESLQGIGL